MYEFYYTIVVTLAPFECFLQIPFSLDHMATYFFRNSMGCRLKGIIEQNVRNGSSCDSVEMAIE
jgi:hypothetical protein